MIVYAKVIRILSLIAIVSGSAYSIYRLFYKDTDNFIGFIVLVLMVIITVVGGIFETNIDEVTCYKLMHFNIVYFVIYAIFIVNGFRCFAIGDVMMGFVSAGIINSVKLFDLSNNYIVDSRKNKTDTSIHHYDL